MNDRLESIFFLCLMAGASHAMSLAHYTTQHIPTTHDAPAPSTCGLEISSFLNEKTQAAKEYEKSCQIASTLDANKFKAPFHYVPKVPQNQLMTAQEAVDMSFLQTSGARGGGGGRSSSGRVKPTPRGSYVPFYYDYSRAEKGMRAYNLSGTIGNQIARILASDYFPWMAMIVAGVIFPR